MIINILAIFIEGVPRHPFSLALPKRKKKVFLMIKIFVTKVLFSSPMVFGNEICFFGNKIVFVVYTMSPKVSMMKNFVNKRLDYLLKKKKKKLLVMKPFCRLIFSSLNT